MELIIFTIIVIAPIIYGIGWYFSDEQKTKRFIGKLPLFELNTPENTIKENGIYQGLKNGNFLIDQSLFVQLKGNLSGQLVIASSSTVYLEHSFIGDIYVKPTAKLTLNGNLEGNIYGEINSEVTINGFIKGDIFTDLLELKQNAIVEGDIKTRKMKISHGSKFQGTVHMSKKLTLPTATGSSSSK